MYSILRIANIDIMSIACTGSYLNRKSINKKLMLIKIKVFPNSKKQEIIKKSENSFDIKVKAKPIKGEANREVIKVLAFHFKVPESRIRLIKGFKQRNKVFEIILTS